LQRNGRGFALVISHKDIAHHARLDADGELLNIGDLVRIPKMPRWLLHDLPEDEHHRLKTLENAPLHILEFDAHGYVWFGEDSPWFCVRPTELIRAAATRVAPTKAEP
jgi:hypothetical protein